MKGAMAKLFAKVLRISKASQVVLVIKNLLASAGRVRDTGLIPESKRSLGGRHGNSLQYSFLKNPTDRGAWQAIAHRVAECQHA